MNEVYVIVSVRVRVAVEEGDDPVSRAFRQMYETLDTWDAAEVLSAELDKNQSADEEEVSA